MEYNDNEQGANLDANRPSGQPHSRENAGESNASVSFVPMVLARLGLNQIASSPTTSEEQVVDALNSPSWPVRLAAIQQLAMQVEQIPLAVVLRALHDEHPDVRAAAVRTVSACPVQVPVEWLVEALHDSEWTVRAAAVLALGRLKEQPPLDPLIAALHDEDASVRANAAWSLGTLGEQAPLAPLANALRGDPAWIVREAAVLALGERGTQAPAALFLVAQTDSDEPVRQAAELVLQRIYPELLSSSSEHTSSRVLDDEASDSPQVNLNGQRDHHPLLKKPTAPVRPTRPQRQPARSTRRLFPPVVAAVMAALLMIAVLLSRLAILHSLPVSPSSHATFALPSNVSIYRASGSLEMVAWSEDGTEIAATNTTGIVYVWHTGTGHPISTFQGKFLNALSLVWSSNHSLLVVAEATDRTVQVWNALTERRILTTPPLHGIASAATWSPDGRQVAFDGGDQTVEVWNIITGKQIVTYRGHTGRITALSWSPDGTEIASASMDRTVQIWNAATGQKDWPSFVHTDAISLVAWSPDDTRCAVATLHGLVEVWDNPSWNKVQIAPAQKGETVLNHPLVVSMAWSRDGTHLAFTTATDGLVHVWDASTARPLYTYHTQQTNDVAWSPDGTSLALASGNGSVQVWPSPHTLEADQPGPH